MKRWNLWIITLMGIAAANTTGWGQQDEEEVAETRQREAVRQEVIAVQSARDAARAAKEIAEQAAAEAAEAAMTITQEATEVIGSQAGRYRIFSTDGEVPFGTASGPAAMHWTHEGGQQSAEQMKLMKELKELGKKYQSSDSADEQSEAKLGMRKILGQQYDSFLETQDKQIEELEARIDELRSKLAKRREAKDRMVDLKLEMLISEADGLGWPDNATNVFYFNRATNMLSPLEPAIAPAAPSIPKSNLVPSSRAR